jgi:hypothetical protein
VSLKSTRVRVEALADNAEHLANCISGVVRELKLMELAEKSPAWPPSQQERRPLISEIYAASQRIKESEDARYVKTPWGLLDRYAQLFVAT